MRRVALATLRHDALRSALLVLGLATAWALVAVQLGLRRGFELSSSAIPAHAGGDLWITARGVRVVDDGEPVARSDASSLGDGCAKDARPLIVDYNQARRADGSLVTVQILAADGASGAVPWGVAAGDPSALSEARAVGVDLADTEKLGLPADPLGATLELRSGAQLTVRVVTRGARSFTQTPYLFTSTATARSVLALPEDAATFWILDRPEEACASKIETDAAAAKLGAVRRTALEETTRAHWVESSGIGSLLWVGTLMAAIVGGAAMLLSTATLVRTHTKEIATVRALGASRREIASFVAWQVGVVSVAAGTLALGLATALSSALRSTGLTVVVGPSSWIAGGALAALTTLLASAFGARVLARLDPRQVIE